MTRRKSMKRVYNILVILFGLLTVATMNSCSLDEQVYTEVDKGEYVKNAQQAESVLLGVYKGLGVDGVYGHNLSMILDMPNDLSKAEGTSTVGLRLQASNAYSTTDAEVQETWAALYAGVYNANSFLETMAARLPEFPEKEVGLGEIYVAEAKVLRAIYYFELVRWFGNVPLITSTEMSRLHPSKFVQEEPVKVYEYIEKDLLEAIPVLPWVGEDSRTNTAFRISKGTAYGLLAKVYATWAGYPLQDKSKWELAAGAAAEVVNSGKHSLVPSYKTLWTNCANNVWNEKESLLEISYWSPQSTNTTSGRVGKWNGVSAANGSIKGSYNIALYKVNPKFVAEWKDYDKDERWSFAFADYKYTVDDGKTILANAKVNGVATDITFEMAMNKDWLGWDISWRSKYSGQLSPRKWDIEEFVKDENQLPDNNYSNVNWYVLRYADVLLLYAEALNEQFGKPTSEAYEAINQVRRRGFGLDVTLPSAEADLPADMTYVNFQQAIKDERSYELCHEGHRRQDLIRWGEYYETVQATYKKMMDWHENATEYYLGAEYTFKNKNELLPIPQREMDLCEQFEQNQGWK